jgi:hypothetical protein
MGIVVGIGAILIIGFCMFCLWCYLTDPTPGLQIGEPSHLHPDVIAEVEAITGESFYDTSYMDPMINTVQSAAALAAAKQQAIAAVCASRQARGLPTYV